MKNIFKVFQKTSVAISVILVLGTASTVKAADFDFFGNFTNDNDIFRFDFTVGADSDITIFSSSWDDGGLDPILAIWDSAGNLIAEQDDGQLTGSETSNGVSYDYDIWDSYYTEFLTAGSYTATIGQYNNFANGTNLSDGFRYDGAGNENFTSAFGCSNGQFCGVFTDNDNRTSEYAFHILNVDDAVVVDPDPNSIPEPASLLGLLTVGSFGTFLKRKRKA